MVTSMIRFPLYGEIKIALLVCLWYPKSQVHSNARNYLKHSLKPIFFSPGFGFWQGISYVYEKLLCPYMSRHELNIDQGILVLKIRGHTVIVQLLQYVYQWTLQIFRNLQQQFDKVCNETNRFNLTLSFSWIHSLLVMQKNKRLKSKERHKAGASFMFLR